VQPEPVRVEQAFHVFDELAARGAAAPARAEEPLARLAAEQGGLLLGEPDQFDPFLALFDPEAGRV
jgi:hypothetical protein